MKKITCFIVFFISILLISHIAWAEKRFKINHADINEYKKLFDDPRPFYTLNEQWKKMLPAEVYDSLIFEPEEMKKAWAQIVGFKAPDVVGKIVPDIKPGKYTLVDKKKYRFDDLMPELLYTKFNEPGVDGPNHAGNFTEFEIVPTQQYYFPTPVSEATMENTGKTKLSDDGYIQQDTYINGYPFPRPSGPRKAWQILYNFSKKYSDWDSYIAITRGGGVNPKFKLDYSERGYVYNLKTNARVQSPAPWFDARAERMREEILSIYEAVAPRDEFGNAISTVAYTDPDKPSNGLIYLNMIRRVRKMSASDSQDQAVGVDMCYDDSFGFSQSITRSSFPFDVKIVEEREYLVPALTLDGAPWFDSKNNFLHKGLKFERRPVYVMEITELDPNYVYSKRIILVDRETFMIILTMNYDQKGRLYRSYSMFKAFLSKMGVINAFQELMGDHIDVHSTVSDVITYPTPFLTRRDVGIKRMMKGK